MATDQLYPLFWLFDTRTLGILTDLADFAEIWAQNLLDQQWLTNGVCTRSSTLDAESQDQISPWPEPTTERPDEETLIAWSLLDGDCEATDGCTVEPDGICSHGHPSWVLKLGMI